MHTFAQRDTLASKSLFHSPGAARPVSVRRALGSMMAASALGGLLAVGGMSTALAEATALSGQSIALSCAVCHGEQGRGNGAVPPLTGRSADDLYATLMTCKSGKKPGTVMGRHAKAYSDAELRAVSEYFASVPPVAK